MERATTPTEKLVSASERFDTEDERKAFIEGANYIMDSFEHWANGLWAVEGGPDQTDEYKYGFLVAADIRNRCLPMFRKVEHKENTK